MALETVNSQQLSHRSNGQESRYAFNSYRRGTPVGTASDLDNGRQSYKTSSRTMEKQWQQAAGPTDISKEG